MAGRFGRQDEARRNDIAVLEAARDVFTTQGAGAPISAVARRAGVGMGTLYRRYGSKTELLQALCLLAMDQAEQAAIAALAAEDPWAGLTGYVRTCVEQRSGALAGLAGQVQTTEQMRRAARRGMRRSEELVRRAHHDGRLRPDVTALDIAWLIELFSRSSVDSSSRPRLLAIALDGLSTVAGAPLPGRPPSRRRYGQRWA